MLYLIKVDKVKDRDSTYHLFDTHTESVIEANTKLVLELINTYKMEIKNIYIEDNTIQIKDWPHKIEPYSRNKKDRESSYVLLGRVREGLFKTVVSIGRVDYLSEESLKSVIEKGWVANCEYAADGDKTYKSVDTYSIKTDPNFIKHIREKYTEFIAKTALLGMDTSFKYTIENEEVKLTSYTGSSKKVILPSFITTVCGRAFHHTGIQELKLNEGLKYIGKDAFCANNLNFVSIPSTVEFVGQSAFYYNVDGAHNKKIYTKLNKNTLILY